MAKKQDSLNQESAERFLQEYASAAEAATISALPFVKRGAGPASWWAPQPAGAKDATTEFESDCLLGEHYAEAFVLFLGDPHRSTLRTTTLQLIVTAMLEKPENARRGLVVGFFSALEDGLSANLQAAWTHMRSRRANALQSLQRNIRRLGEARPA